MIIHDLIFDVRIVIGIGSILAVPTIGGSPACVSINYIFLSPST
jgi:hypothetical protein